MLRLKDQFTKQNRIDDESLSNLPPRKVTWTRVGLHLTFWAWDAYSAYVSLDRVLRPNPGVPPDPDLFRLMFSTHLATTIILFYLYGYLVAPSLLNTLVAYRASGQLKWPQITFVTVASVMIFVAFNVYDYYLFTYAADHFIPVSPYIKRYNDLLLASGPFGIFKDYTVIIFIWAYNMSYLMLPLLLRIIREAISWGVMSIRQKEQNQILIRNQLQLLQHQINPHFLFNVFNNIYSLIQRTNTEAAELLRKLSQLMHYTLYDTNHDFVPLEGELQFLRNYVEIEQTRHFDPKRISFQQTGDSRDLLVPPLLLVTFIENAFKHGLHDSFEEGWVRIEILVDKQNQALQVTVANSISWENDERKRPGGLGLVNAKKRLNLLFNPDLYSLNVQESSTDYQLNLRIPLKWVRKHDYQTAH